MTNFPLTMQNGFTCQRANGKGCASLPLQIQYVLLPNQCCLQKVTESGKVTILQWAVRQWCFLPSSVITTLMPALGDCLFTAPRNSSMTPLSSLSDRHQATGWPVIRVITMSICVIMQRCITYLHHTHQEQLSWLAWSRIKWSCVCYRYTEWLKQNGYKAFSETRFELRPWMLHLVDCFLSRLRHPGAYRKGQSYASPTPVHAVS